MGLENDTNTQKAPFFTKIPPQISFLVLVFISGMLLTGIFRVILLLMNTDQTQSVPFGTLVFAVINRGGLFDAAVNSYILLLPFAFIFLGYFIRPARKIFNYTAIFLLFIFYIFAIAIHSTDIPFFSYFNSRLTNSILNWTEDIGLMIKSRFSTVTYYPYIGLFLVLSAAFCFWIKIIANKTILSNHCRESRVYTKIIYFIVFGFLIFNGIRGNLNYKVFPLRTADSFFSQYSFPNQLGLNPLFTFFESYKEKNPKIMSDKDAVQNAQRFLNVKQKYDSPIARDVTFDTASAKPNVVIFLVESLSTHQLKRYGNKKNFMPFIDSLTRVAAVFDNVYTAGMHTYSGVFSTLFSIPSILNSKPFSSTEVNGQKLSGVSNTLHRNGYRTIFFCSGDKKFDNMNSFLSANDFDRIYSQDDYPKDAEITEWGVHDNTMYRYAVPVLSEESAKKQPFLAVILTISSHESLSLPKKSEFKPTMTDAYEMLFEYTDWAISEFFKSAQKQEWFENTIFAFIGDHGQNFDPTYDVPLSYFHSPMIFYAPELISPAEYKNPGLQIDLFPTLMGYLKIPYVNNTFGIDLRKEQRPYAYFSSDDKFGCIGSDYYLIMRIGGADGLYKYKSKDLTNYIQQNSALADSMRIYTYSMIQTANRMIKQKMLGLPQGNE
ncbi:MAG: sulfatase-like hydrolase/transferase [Ignavibacteriae bacterium]|nr:sulfatase-like hydrolase/transferase [Ignavibacteriota bacterium]